MTEFGRRASDQDVAEGHDKFMRSAAHIAKWTGTVQLLVQIIGRTVIWVLEVRDARRPPVPVERADGSVALINPPPIAHPEMPWSYWLSIVGFAALMLLAAALYRNQIDNPGRIWDVLLDWIPSRGGRVVARSESVEVDVEPEEDP